MLGPTEKLPLSKQKDIFEQIAELLDSGVPLEQSIRLASAREQKKSNIFQKILLHLQNGLPFSKTLEKVNGHFDPFLPFFAKLGEDSGTLSKALKDFSQYLQSKLSVVAQIKKQLFYPVLVLSAALISLLLMVHFLLPTMLTFFNESNIPVPFFLNKLWTIKLFIQNHILKILLVVTIAGLYLFKVDQAYLVQLLEKVPLFKKWMDMAFLWRFFQNLAVLVQAGVPFTESLTLQERLFSQQRIKVKINKIIFQLNNGNSFSATLAKETWLEPVYQEIIHTSEHSGNFAVALGKIAHILEKEITLKVNELIKWLEPATTILLGGLVTLFLLGIFYPLTKVLNSLG